MFVPRSIAYFRQPFGAQRINRRHFLASRLNFLGFWTPAGFIDLVSGQVAQSFGTWNPSTVPPHAKSLGVGGVVTMPTGATGSPGGYLKFANQTGLDKLTTQGCVLTIAQHTGVATGITHFPVSSRENIVGGWGFHLFLDDGNQIGTEGPGVYIIASGGSSPGTGPTGSPWGVTAENQAHLFGAGWDSTNIYVYYDKDQRFSTAFGRGPNADSNRRTYVNTASGGGTTTQAGTALIVGLNSPISVGEWTEFAKKPWNVLEPMRRPIRFYSLPAAEAVGLPPSLRLNQAVKRASFY